MSTAVEDDLAIRNLIARVAHLTDDWSTTEEYVANYTKDCVWEIPESDPYEGHEGMTRRLNEMVEQGVCGPGIGARHCLTTVEVTLAGDVAESRSICLFFVQTDVSPTLAAIARYVDTVKRTAEGWKLARRVISFC